MRPISAQWNRFLASPYRTWSASARAIDVDPGLADDLFLHAGPPISWERNVRSAARAVMGGIAARGMAGHRRTTRRARGGRLVRFDPCHHHRAVGPMAGLITPSMPVFILEDLEGAGRGKPHLLHPERGTPEGAALPGAYCDEVLARLRMMRDELAPVLAAALAAHGAIDLRLLMAQALQMGDEGHNRNRAATSLFLRELAPAIIRTAPDSETAARAVEFIHRNDHFFPQPVDAGWAKCMLLAAEGEALFVHGHGDGLATARLRHSDLGPAGPLVSSGRRRWSAGLYFPRFHCG